MTATFVLLMAMFKKYWIELRRYSFNTLSSLVAIYLLFLLIFYGARGFAGGNPAFGETLSGLVVGFMVWLFALYAYSELSWVLLQEAQQGTLEQLSMSPVGLGRVLLSRIAASMVYHLLIVTAFLFLMMASTGKWLNLDILSLLPLMLMTISGVLGIGFIMGGLALVFKQVQASFQILQFLFVALIAAPPDKFPFVKFLPLSWGTRLIAKVMIGNTSILEIPPGDLLFLLVNSVFYFSLGYAFFKLFERMARNRGLLGHY